MLKEYTKSIDASGIERLRIKIKTQGGVLVDMVFQYETFYYNNWIAIVRYDLAHGFFHRDVMQPNGEKVKTAIEISGLKEAAIFAEQDIKDKWEFYKEKYIKQIKK